MSKDTTALLQKLRSLMRDVSVVGEAIDAYIVPSGDAHLSEYIAACDERRAFISGFNGSAGTAVITLSKAALWTDGRYYLQAQAQMDKNWTLMKDGLADTPSQGEWLCKELSSSSRVGVDPLLMSFGGWEALQKQLSGDDLSLVPVNKNLIDAVWVDQAPRPLNQVFTQPVKYTGMSWQEKVKVVRTKMAEKKASVLVVTALDEIAWLLNLRGSDISFNPVFFAYVLLTNDSVLLFVNESKVTAEVKKHLEVGEGQSQVNILPYDSILEQFSQLVEKTKEGKIWINSNTNYALCSLLPKKKQLNQPSPIAVLKSVKNSVEIEGMRQAHIKDAVALCEYFAWLEEEAPKGKLTEIDGASHCETLRSQQADYISLSFQTISAVGGNGSVIHYRPKPETNKTITVNELYLLDSGGQYRDGTTDVTRTVHLGQPKEFEKDCFTRVLKGQIAVARAIFPNGTKGLFLDSFARQHLWNIGLDYAHGTGHGVGSFLNVHEGPCGIGIRIRPEDIPLKEGMVLSDEPGYYEDGQFGIRLENLVLITAANTPHNFKEKGFLTTEPLTLVPLQIKMINRSMLTKDEVSWLNDYHQQCRKVIGAELQKQGRTKAYNWLMKETEPLN